MSSSVGMITLFFIFDVIILLDDNIILWMTKLSFPDYLIHSYYRLEWKKHAVIYHLWKTKQSILAVVVRFKLNTWRRMYWLILWSCTYVHITTLPYQGNKLCVAHLHRGSGTSIFASVYLYSFDKYYFQEEDENVYRFKISLTIKNLVGPGKN